MRRRLAAAFVAALGLAPAFAAPLAAQDAETHGPVVVELFTSQGCSACPPADQVLAELAQRDDVVALALHIDYWDYIGWADTFADAAFSDRQRGYAVARGDRMLYTPEVVVGGRDDVVGTKALRIAALIEAHGATPDAVAVVLRRDGGRVTVEARAQSDGVGPAVVQLAVIRPAAEVAIDSGENAGRTLAYHNIVTDLATLGTWDGRDVFRASAEVPADHAAAVIVQTPDHGPILGAAQLD